jgi:hypothetical protein
LLSSSGRSTCWLLLARMSESKLIAASVGSFW